MLRAFIVFWVKAFALFIVFFALFVLLAWESMGPPRGNLLLDVARTQAGLLDGAVNSYHKDVGCFPPTLDALRFAPSDIEVGKWEGPYLYKDIPLDPWEHAFQYATPGKHNPSGFDVWTISPDGQEIGNWREPPGPSDAQAESHHRNQPR